MALRLLRLQLIVTNRPMSTHHRCCNSAISVYFNNDCLILWAPRLFRVRLLSFLTNRHYCDLTINVILERAVFITPGAHVLAAHMMMMMMMMMMTTTTTTMMMITIIIIIVFAHKDVSMR